ncbi:MAG TPA: response regulator [Sulfuricurvum sp.]|nr:response regulator [Sulfuricurvum sp.]
MFTSQHFTLLYIDADHESIQSNIAYVHKQGIRVLTASNTQRAYELYQANKIDFIIIDLPLPHENGLDFIRHLRQLQIDIPVIITAADSDNKILLDAINLEISRYMIKPFEPSELVAALSSASKKLLVSHNEHFVDLDHGFTYDTVNKSVNRPDGSIIHLSKKEYLLLELLLKNNRKIIPYATIEAEVWKSSGMTIDTLRTLVRAVRKKIYPDIITNNNGIGYKISL